MTLNEHQGRWGRLAQFKTPNLHDHTLQQVLRPSTSRRGVRPQKPPGETATRSGRRPLRTMQHGGPAAARQSPRPVWSKSRPVSTVSGPKVHTGHTAGRMPGLGSLAWDESPGPLVKSVECTGLTSPREDSHGHAARPGGWCHFRKGPAGLGSVLGQTKDMPACVCACVRAGDGDGPSTWWASTHR